MSNDTILESIDQKFKIGDIDSFSFKKAIDDKKHSNLLNFSREREYTYYKSDDETYFEYDIFKLYCLKASGARQLVRKIVPDNLVRNLLYFKRRMYNET